MVEPGTSLYDAGVRMSLFDVLKHGTQFGFASRNPVLAQWSRVGGVLIGKMQMNGLSLWMICIGKTPPMLLIGKGGETWISLKIPVIREICFV